MRILLDTHTFLWLVESDSVQLSERVQQLIQDEETVAILSIANLWELAIKQHRKIDAFVALC